MVKEEDNVQNVKSFVLSTICSTLTTLVQHEFYLNAITLWKTD